MNDEMKPATKAASEEVAAILARSAAEPGINEMLALARLSADMYHVQQSLIDMASGLVASQSCDVRGYTR